VDIDGEDLAHQPVFHPHAQGGALDDGYVAGAHKIFHPGQDRAHQLIFGAVGFCRGVVTFVHARFLKLKMSLGVSAEE
jgi:hypothetical protein